MNAAGDRDAVSDTAPDGTGWSARGAGEALVFVHGVGMNRAIWERQMVAFSASHRTIAYDLLGHGESPLPPAQPCLEDFSDQLARLLDHLGLARATLVGHSMGALVALDLALRQPGRVDRLVTLNAVHGRPAEQRRAVRQRARRLRERGIAGTLDETLGRWFGPAAGDAERDDIRRVREWLLAVDREGYARAYQVFATADEALEGRVAGLRPPALFLTGELDPHSTPAMSTRLAAEAQRGEAGALPGERHMMAWESPATTNRAIAEFLARGGERGTSAAAPADRRVGG